MPKIEDRSAQPDTGEESLPVFIRQAGDIARQKKRVAMAAHFEKIRTSILIQKPQVYRAKPS